MILTLLDSTRDWGRLITTLPVPFNPVVMMEAAAVEVAVERGIPTNECKEDEDWLLVRS